MATVKTDALSISIKNVDGSEINIHPDVLAIEPTLEAMPIYQLVRNTSFTRTNKLSFEYKIRAKSAFKDWKNDGSGDDARNASLSGKFPVIDVLDITLTKADKKMYVEDIDKVDVGTEQFNSYIEQATVAVMSSIRDAKDGAMFKAIEDGATAVDATGYAQLKADGTVAKSALPAGALARVETKDYFAGGVDGATAVEAKAFATSIHTRIRAILRMGAKNSVEEAFALATYGNKKANIVVIVDEIYTSVFDLIPNVLTSPRGYQDLFIDGELNIFKGVMMVSAVRIPEKRNFYVITKGVRGTVGLAEQSTSDMLFRVKEHPTDPEDYWQLKAYQFWKWQAVEPHFAFVSKTA